MYKVTTGGIDYIFDTTNPCTAYTVEEIMEFEMCAQRLHQRNTDKRYSPVYMEDYRRNFGVPVDVDFTAKEHFKVTHKWDNTLGKLRDKIRNMFPRREDVLIHRDMIARNLYMRNSGLFGIVEDTTVEDMQALRKRSAEKRQCDLKWSTKRLENNNG